MKCEYKDKCKDNCWKCPVNWDLMPIVGGPSMEEVLGEIRQVSPDLEEEEIPF